MCGLRAKRSVTHWWGSVARWTRWNWLGSRPSVEDAPEKPRPVMGRGVSHTVVKRIGYAVPSTGKRVSLTLHGGSSLMGAQATCLCLMG
jgi:hypothetical protein